MSNNVLRRQKKLEQQKKKRKAKQAKPAAFSWAKVPKAAFGPCWISEALDEENEDMPPLIQVLVSRRVGPEYVVGFVLVDRTCLGIKEAMTMRLGNVLEVESFADRVDETDPMKRCEPLLAQSVVYHALDYANSLDFSPHSDFDPRLFEPRPETLLETPLSRPEKPLFIAGPDDEAVFILARLRARVGSEFDYVLAEGASETEHAVAQMLLDGSFLSEDDELSSEDDEPLAAEGERAAEENT